MTDLLAIAAGGAAGAVARALLTQLALAMLGERFPLGTLLVNVLGCLAIGVLMTLVETRSAITPAMRALLITGFLGAFTTFSTFGFETVHLVREQAIGSAVLSVALNVGLGVAAVCLGRELVLRTS